MSSDCIYVKYNFLFMYVHIYLCMYVCSSYLLYVCMYVFINV